MATPLCEPPVRMSSPMSSTCSRQTRWRGSPRTATAASALRWASGPPTTSAVDELGRLGEEHECVRVQPVADLDRREPGERAGVRSLEDDAQAVAREHAEPGQVRQVTVDLAAISGDHL